MGGATEKSKIGIKYQSRAAELYRDEIKTLASENTQKKSTFAQFSNISVRDQPDDFESDSLPKSSETFEPSLSSSHAKENGSNTTPTQSSSPSRVVGGKKAASKRKPGLGAKKVSTSAFEDFDKPDEFDDTIGKTPVSAAGKQDKSQENIHSHSGAIRSSRLAYTEDEKNPSEQETKYQSPVGASKPTTQTRQSTYRSDSSFLAEPGDAQKRFGNVKSLSSSQYYGENDKKVSDGETERRLMKFSGKGAISSAEYFERDETPDLTAEGFARKIATTATTDFSQITTVVVDSGRKIQTLASDLLSDLQNRYQG